MASRGFNRPSRTLELLFAELPDPARVPANTRVVLQDVVGPNVGRILVRGFTVTGGVLVPAWLTLSTTLPGTGVTIGIVNQSAVITPDQMPTLVAAVQRQLTEHMPPLWPTFKPPTVRWIQDTSEFTGNALLYPLTIVDGPLAIPTTGFHDFSGNPALPPDPFPFPGRPYAMVTTLFSAGDVFVGPLPVSFIVSHEVMEEVINSTNPALKATCRLFQNCCAQLPGFTVDAEGAPFSTVSAFFEIADPVEASGYLVSVNSQLVTLANFVSQNYFSEAFALGLFGVPGFPVPPPGTKWDFLDLLNQPGFTGPFDLQLGVLAFDAVRTTQNGLRIDVPPFDTSFQNPVIPLPDQCATTLPPLCFPPPAGPPYTLPPGDARVAIQPQQWTTYFTFLGAFAMAVPTRKPESRSHVLAAFDARAMALGSQGITVVRPGLPAEVSASSTGLRPGETREHCEPVRHTRERMAQILGRRSED